MNVQVVGAGAIGLLFAAKLARVCSKVEIMTRTKEQSDLLRSQGVQIQGQVQAEYERLSFTSFCNQLNLKDLEWDYILLMVKQISIDEPLLQFLKSQLSAHTQIVCFQNGVGHVEKLKTYVPEDQILLAVTTEGAKKDSATTVEHTGKGTTFIGEAILSQGQPDRNKKISGLVELLKKAGFVACMSDDVQRIVWNKLVMNSIINPLTALLQIHNGQLLQSNQTLQLMRALFEEAIKVAERNGIKTSSDLWDQVISVCEKTSKNSSSMLQDIRQKKQTEIEWINGSLIRIAAGSGLTLPVNETVYKLIKAVEEKKVHG